MSNLPHQLEQSSLAGLAVAVLALACLAWLSLQTNRAPPAQAADATPGVFSAARAAADFRALTVAPRPIASQANADARAYLLARLSQLGVEHEVQEASSQKTSLISMGLNHKYEVSLGVTHNVVARVKGAAIDRGRRAALLIASHYDSAPDKLGAADAGATVAAMLETLRAMQHGAPPENDVIFLFADGEQAGSLGARAFVEQHPWARKVGLVLQFDALGNGGPLLLAGSRGGDGKLVEGWAGAVPLPLGSSMLPLLAASSPGPLAQLGKAGLRFANIEQAPGSQGGLDTPELVDPRTIQHTGDTMLALVRHFGNRPLAHISDTDRVHFDLPLAGRVTYSGELAWLLTLLTGFVFTVVCGLAVRRSGMALRLAGAGALSFLAIAGGMAVVAVTMWQELPGMHEAYQPMLEGAGARDRWYVLAYLTLGAALFIEAQRRLARTIGLPATVLGALLVLLLLLLCATAFMPGASYLLAWPLLAALLAYGLLYQPGLTARHPALRLLILLAGSAPAVLLLTPLIAQLATLYTPQHSALIMLSLAAMLGLGGALLASVRRRFIAPLLLAGCACSLVNASSLPQYEQPLMRPNSMMYLKDTYSWKAWWLMPAAPLDNWSRPYFGGTNGPRTLREVFGMSQDELWVAPAPRDGIAFPDVIAVRDEEVDGRRRIAFTVRSKNKAPTIHIRVADAYTLEARLNGKVITNKRSKLWSLSLHGSGTSTNLVELDIEPDTIARVYIQERIPGLPDEAGHPRPGRTPHTGMTVASDMLVFY